MTFNPEKLLNLPPIETISEHSVRDVILYALGVGVGIDAPTDAYSLKYVYEEDISVLPTMAAVLASPGFWAKEPRYGIDWKKLLAGEQLLEFHKPLPVAGKLMSAITIEDIYDKGADKGAVMYWRREIYDTSSGDHLATERKSAFLRGDGGKGGRTDRSPTPPTVPDRPCDIQAALSTRTDQALLYRLSGDYNPLHIDPEIAKNAGFQMPILHGLCTYGIAGRVLLEHLADGEVSKLKMIGCRFSSPVYPGDTIMTEIWRTGDGQAAFQCRAKERDVIVLSHGQVRYS